MKEKSLKKREIKFRLSEELYQILLQKSEASNKNVSAFLRDNIIEKKAEVSNPINTKDLAKLLGSANKIGNNLNQIAHTLNIANNANKLDDVKYESILDQLIILEYGLNNLLKEYKC